jgi:hypothetical protein
LQSNPIRRLLYGDRLDYNQVLATKQRNELTNRNPLF